MQGLPAIGARGLGIFAVTGMSREPMPPARMIAFKTFSPKKKFYREYFKSATRLYSKKMYDT